MRLTLARPSFWTEPRDADAWVRALGVLEKLPTIPDPWPCWETHLRPWLSRRAVPGLYGVRWKPYPSQLWGVGLIEQAEGIWQLSEASRVLLGTDRPNRLETLARLVVRRSPWLRLLLIRLQTQDWAWQHPPSCHRRLQVRQDLNLPRSPLRSLPAANLLLGDQAIPNLKSLKLLAKPADLTPLHGPLCLLQALGWLDAEGMPDLPDDLQAHLGQLAPAGLLRELSQTLADRAGYVPIERAGLALWKELYPTTSPTTLDAWIDLTFGDAIAQGTIEVDAWAPGQPRHGRGLYGDRERKLVRWTIHDDFTLPSGKDL